MVATNSRGKSEQLSDLFGFTLLLLRLYSVIAVFKAFLFLTSYILEYKGFLSLFLSSFSSMFRHYDAIIPLDYHPSDHTPFRHS